jgi:rhodanese-related sulfurtransferase
MSNQARLVRIFQALLRFPMSTSLNPPPRSNASAEPGVQPADGYAGDISPQLAHDWVKTGAAVLVDVRTDAEREWVGYIPGAVNIAWKQWPGMEVSAGFDDAIRLAVTNGKRVVMLCRSGVRSIAAARRASQLGWRLTTSWKALKATPTQPGTVAR